jgi:hypothetical protein
MLSPFARAAGLAAVLIALVLGLVPATAAAADPDPVAACDGTSFTTSTVDGRAVVRCDDGRVRDWQRVAIADAAIDRPTGGSGTLSFTVSRPEAGNPVFLTVRTANETATAPADYTALETALVLEADETSATVAVPIARQTVRQDDETLTVSLADAQGDVVVFDRARAVGTLRNALNATYRPDAEYLCDGGFYSLGDLPAPWTGRGVRCLGRNPQPHTEMDVADVAADPHAGSVTFHFRRPSGHAAIVLAYETVDGSARAGVDYVATSGLALAATDTYVHRITVPLLDGGPDAAGERSFGLRVTSGWDWTPVPTYEPLATIRRLPAPAGEALLGHTLTATVAGATSRQWERCDAQGACADVPGQTGATYTPVPADAGSRLRLRATVSVADGGTAVLRSPATAVVAAAAVDPAAVCDGTPYSDDTVDGRPVVSCDDGGTRDWQRVAVRDATVTRDMGGGGTLRFAVERRSAGNPLWIRYGTSDGTATAGGGYTPASGVLILEADQKSGTVTVPVPAAAYDGDDLTMRLDVGDERDAGIEFLRDAATGTIRNNQVRNQIDAEYACDGGLYDVVIVRGLPNPRCLWPGSEPRTAPWFTDFTVGAPIADPRAGVATFVVRRPVDGGRAWTSWATVDGSARAGVDYTASSGELTWSTGQRVQRVSVPLLDAPGADGDRTFTLRVANAEPAMSFDPAEGTATIRRFTPAIAGLPRVGAPLVGAAPGAATRQWQRCDAQGACWDIPSATGPSYTPTATDVGRRLRVRALLADGDGPPLAAETPLTAPVAIAPADGAAACDGTPFTTTTVDGREVVACEDGGTRDWQRVAIRDAFVRRSSGGATTLRFDVTRPEAGSPLFLRWRTADGTARSGTDYTAQDGVLVLESDQTSATIEVPVAAQPSAVVADDDRSLSVSLADERGAGVEFARDRATGTIGNGVLSRRIDGDETCDGGMYDVVIVDGWRVVRCLSGDDGWATVEAGSPIVDPVAGVATFRLRRDDPHNPLWIDWTTVDGTARAGVDYTASSGQVVMTAGQRVATVSVPIARDADGGDRAFSLRIAGGQASLPFHGTDGTATIRRIAPALAGTPKAGETLTFAGAADATRQWQRCDAQGACWAIPGANAATLALGEELVGSRLRVRATVPGEDGATIAARTPLTAAVAAADPRIPVDPRDPTDPRGPTDPRDPGDPGNPGGPGTPGGPAGPGGPPAGGERPAPTGARVTGRRQQNRDVARAVAGATNVVLRCSQACRLRAPLTVSEAARRRLGLRSTRIGVADGRTGAEGLVRLQVRLARHERSRLLAIGRPVTVVVRVATPRGKTVTVRFRLLPAKPSAARD